MLLLTIHWINCGWLYIANYGESWMPPKDQEYDVTKAFTGTNFERYILLIYYACQILMGSDIFPISQAEIIVGILLVVVGIIIIGYRVGELSNLILQMNQKERET